MADANVPLLAKETGKVHKEEVCIIKISLEENQKQVMEKRISIEGSDGSSPKTYKPDLISIGPYYRKEPAGTENSVKEKFQKSFYGKNKELEEQCRKRLKVLEKYAVSWYAQHMGLQINDQEWSSSNFVEMLLLDGCFILDFFYKSNSTPEEAFKNVEDKEVIQTIKAFMRVDEKVAKTSIDLLLFKNQFPFFILFELHKLKKSWQSDGAAVPAESNHHENENGDALLEKFMTLVKKYNGNPLQKEFDRLVMKHGNDASLKRVNMLVQEHKYKALQKELVLKMMNDAAAFELLIKELIKLVKEYELRQELMVMVKKCFVDRVPKLTPQNVAAHEDMLPLHLLQLVHFLCTPRPSEGTNRPAENTEQINTATELEQDGVRLKKIGKVYSGYNEDNNDGTTLFDIDFNWGRLKIPCFKIEDSTETFFRNMIVFEQRSASNPKYFTDFAGCMGQLIRTKEDVNLLRRRGIILNLLDTDEKVAKMFQEMGKGIVLSSTFSHVYSKVNRFGLHPWNIWMGKLGQDFYYSPWKLISTIVGGLIVSLGTAVSVKNLLK